MQRTDVDGTVVILANKDGTFTETTERSDVSQIPRVASVLRHSGGRGTVPNTTTGECCKICTRGKACGNGCINQSYVCRQPPGCACDARP